MLIFGWGSRQRVIREGDFQCPVCGSGAPCSQIRQRNWFRLFFMHVIPVSGVEDFVVCRKCQTTFRLEALGDQGNLQRDMPASFSVISLIGMVVGLLSLFSFCLFFVSLPIAAVAVVLGHVGLREIQRNRPFTEGIGFAVTAFVSGYTALLISTTVAVLVFVLPNFTTPSRAPGLAGQPEW